MKKVWIVYRSDDDIEILGVFDNELDASHFNEEMADRYAGERIWIGAYPVPFRLQEDFVP